MTTCACKRDHVYHAPQMEAAGLVRCIHGAPGWQERADALYEVANLSGQLWLSGAAIGLLPNGRMVLVTRNFCVGEQPS